MSKKQKVNKIITSPLIKRAFDLLNASCMQVVKQTNTLMVFTYFQLGHLIVENEQAGKGRAFYGKETIRELSLHLTKKFGNGFSARNLDQIRLFYLEFKTRINFNIPQTASAEYFPSKKPQTVSAKLLNSATLSRNSFTDLFPLSWSHYVVLCRIKNSNERSFYEIESIQGNWSVRELQRQFDSL